MIVSRIDRIGRKRLPDLAGQFVDLGDFFHFVAEAVDPHVIVIGYHRGNVDDVAMDAEVARVQIQVVSGVLGFNKP